MILSPVERVQAMRRAQGLPPHLEDPTQIRRLAALVRPVVEAPRRRRRRAA